MNRRELFSGAGAAVAAAVLPKPAYTQSIFVGRPVNGNTVWTRQSSAWAQRPNGTVVFYPRALTNAELIEATR